MNKRNPTIIILVLGALTTISPLSIDMYLSSFQALALEFNTTVPKVSLSLSSYFIGLAIGQLCYGPLLDRFGRKPPLYFGLGLYILASLACSFAQTLDLFLLCRLFQGFGGCVAGVAATAMVNDFILKMKGPRSFPSVC